MHYGKWKDLYWIRSFFNHGNHSLRLHKKFYYMVHVWAVYRPSGFKTEQCFVNNHSAAINGPASSKKETYCVKYVCIFKGVAREALSFILDAWRINTMTS